MRVTQLWQYCQRVPSPRALYATSHCVTTQGYFYPLGQAHRVIPSS